MSLRASIASVAIHDFHEIALQQGVRVHACLGLQQAMTAGLMQLPPWVWRAAR